MNCEPGNQHCVVRYRNAWYALPSGAVREVMLCPEITQLPNASRILKGISHVNNEFLAVTEPLLDQPGKANHTPCGRSRQLLVVTGLDGVWGVLVDEVAKLAILDDFQPHESKEGHLCFLGAATNMGNDLRVLDVNQTYRSVMLELRSNWKPGVGDVETAQKA